MTTNRSPKKETETTSSSAATNENSVDKLLDTILIVRAKNAAADLAKTHPNAKTFTIAPVSRPCSEHGQDLGLLVESPESPTAKTVVQRPMAMMFSIPASAPTTTTDTKAETQAAPAPKSAKK